MKEVTKYQISIAIFVILTIGFATTTYIFASKWDTNRYKVENAEEKVSKFERASKEQELALQSLLGLVEWSAAAGDPLTLKMAADAMKEAIIEANLPPDTKARAELMAKFMWSKKFNSPMP